MLAQKILASYSFEPLGTMQIFTVSIKIQFPYRFEYTSYVGMEGCHSVVGEDKKIKHFFCAGIYKIFLYP